MNDFRSEIPKLEELNVNELYENTSLFWFVHPTPEDPRAVPSWKEFLSEVYDEDAKVFLSPVLKGIDEELQEGVKNLSDNDQLYLSGWIGFEMKKELRKKLPERHNIVLGYRFGHCVGTYVDDLKKIGVPREKIAVMSRYSFCCGKESCIEEAKNRYKSNDVMVYEGTAKEFLENPSAVFKSREEIIT